MLKSLTLLLVCQLCGEVLAHALGLPVPGPVIGMVLLFIGLRLRGVSSEMEASADGLLGNLALLFVPAGVGVIDHLALIEDEWQPIAAALLISTLVTIAIIGSLLQRVLAPMADGPGEGA